MHRETAVEAETEFAPEEMDEIRERLFRKLQRLKKRDEEKEAQSQRLRSEAPREGDPEGGGT
jgi:hypothetical protein